MATEDENTPLLKAAESSTSNGSIGGSDGEKQSKSKDGEKEKPKSASFSEMFQFATCGDVVLLVLGSLTACAHGAGWPLLSIVFGDMTTDFINAPNASMYTNTSGNFTPPPFDFEAEMTKYMLYYIYIGAGVFAASYVQISFWMTACERQVQKMRRAFLKAILRQEIGWFDKHSSGELTTRLADDLERVREGIGDKFGISLQWIAQFISGFAIAFWKSWRVTLVMMSLSPLLIVCAAFISKTIASFSAREQSSYAAAGSIAEEVLSCIRTVISFNGQRAEIKRYAKALEDSKRMGVRKSLVLGLGMGLTMFIMFGAYGLAFWYGSTEVDKYYNTNMEEGTSPGNVFTVFFCVMIASFSLGNAAPNISAIATAKGAAAVLLEIINRKPEIDASSEMGERPGSVTGNITFRSVDFAYPTREEVTVLGDFNLEVEAGQTVALVGPSGCGKSTVVNLIQRFYDPKEGQVLLDGKDLQALNVSWLRRNIGLVSQEPVLFGLTIEENILLGNPQATHAQIEEAAKQANAHSFISKLPKGYETLVGERGAQLSGGQKQRIAIARALVRNPRILLLDEATSALDSESEKVVQTALDKAREGRTTVVVAHRLSTVQNADAICVLEGGRVVERGRHAELMALQGVYHQLVTLQTIAEREEGEEGEEGEEEVAVEDVNVENGTVVNGEVPRSGSPVKRTPSRQLSRQTSTQPARQPSTQQSSSGDKQDTPEEEEEPAEKPGFCRMFRENYPECGFILLGCFAAILNGAMMPLFAIFFSEIVRVFGERGDKLKADGLFWSMMFLALGGSSFVSNSIQNFSFGSSGERLTFRLRLKTLKSLLRQDVAYYDDPKHSTGALTTRLATDASNVKNATGIRLAVMIQAFTSLAAGLAIAFYFGWKLALVILGGVPLMGLAGAAQMKMFKGTQKRDNKLLEEAGKTASEAIENIRTVQSLCREEHFFENYSKQLVLPLKQSVRLAHIYGIVFGFSQGIIFWLYGGSFRFGAYLVTHDGMSPDSVYRVFFAIAYTGMSVGQMTSMLPDYTKAQMSAGLIFKTLDLIPSIDVYSQRGERPANISGDIQFRDVRFRYPTRPDVEVLRGINLRVRPGQTAALVGVSGCGKSTVVSLIQRYYDVNSGDITVDGVRICDYNLAHLRSLLSVVSQEPVLFDCSIRDNISYGLESDVGMDDVIKAARVANAHEFISNLPQGYDTNVGEKGTQLSGGQKQRVAIARALVRNPRILLLDEATSALDTESEKVVQKALDNAQAGRTCIVIAHRLSTIQNADVIFLMENGVVIEQGTHQELLAKEGGYAALVNNQKLAK